MEMLSENRSLTGVKLGQMILMGVIIAHISGAMFFCAGYIFMEFGNEDIVLGVELFSLYSLPYGLTVAWLADWWSRRKGIRLPSGYTPAKRCYSKLSFYICAGAMGAAALFGMLTLLFSFLGLHMIWISAASSAIIVILIRTYYSGRNAPIRL